MNEHRALDRPVGTQRRRPDVRARSAARLAPVSNPVAQLAAALEILAARMRDAVAERRASPPGSERYRRADALVGHLNELYLQLQRRMEVPAEIWLLGRGRLSAGERP